MPLVKYPAKPLEGEGEPKFYWVSPPNPQGWTDPVLSFWELTAESWTDHHVHIEWVYIVKGQLFIEVDGVEMEFNEGDVALVPGGYTGYYKAPKYAKMLSIYGPNVEAIPAANRLLTKLA